MNLDNLASMLITKVHSAHSFYNPKGAKGRRYDRPSWAVVMKYEGETVYNSNGKQFLSDSSHLVILPNGCSYDWLCNADGHFSIIEFDCDAVLREPISFKVKNSDKILKLFKTMEHYRNLKGPTTELESIRDTYSIIIALLGSSSERYAPSERRERLAPALEYISVNYDKAITNDVLAALTGVSTVYFRKLFTHVMGTSPIAYARGIRIEKAKEILRSDYGTLSDVAVSLGYQSLYDFSRDFKKHTGISPSRYTVK